MSAKGASASSGGITLVSAKISDPWTISVAPSLIDGTVYVVPRHGTLYAVNPDGTIRWQAEVGGLDGYPVAVASDGSVYASTTERELVHISVEGVMLWRAQLTSDERVRISAPAVGPDGRLYVGVGQRLYAIQTKD